MQCRASLCTHGTLHADAVHANYVGMVPVPQIILIHHLIHTLFSHPHTTHAHPSPANYPTSYAHLQISIPIYSPIHITHTHSHTHTHTPHTRSLSFSLCLSVSPARLQATVRILFDIYHTTLLYQE